LDGGHHQQQSFSFVIGFIAEQCCQHEIRFIFIFVFTIIIIIIIIIIIFVFLSIDSYIIR